MKGIRYDPEQLAILSPEDKRVRLAEFDGFSNVRVTKYGLFGDCGNKIGDAIDVIIPDYLNDLNAISRVEARLSDEQHKAFRDRLNTITFVSLYQQRYPSTDEQERAYVSASASQRADAILLVI